MGFTAAVVTYDNQIFQTENVSIFFDTEEKWTKIFLKTNLSLPSTSCSNSNKHISLKTLQLRQVRELWGFIF